MRRWLTCPRCDWQGYEVLQSYAYCCCCNFSPELLDERPEVPIPKWVYDLLATLSKEKLRPTKGLMLGGAV